MGTQLLKIQILQNPCKCKYCASWSTYLVLEPSAADRGLGLASWLESSDSREAWASPGSSFLVCKWREFGWLAPWVLKHSILVYPIDPRLVPSFQKAVIGVRSEPRVVCNSGNTVSDSMCVRQTFCWREHEVNMRKAGISCCGRACKVLSLKKLWWLSPSDEVWDSLVLT